MGFTVGRWRLEQTLGTGGMAAVYEGRDSGGGTAAVKILHPDHATNPNIVARFKREALIMGLSNHPRAVQVYEEGYTEINEPYYAMELLGQETLERRLKLIELFDPSRALGYIASLLEVLETYHHHGVIHRDIKPSNLIMDGDAVRLVDFGVSRYRDDAMPPEEYTQQGSMIGTPAYMAPEQAMGEVDRMDQRTDLFAIGAVLYELVCGKRVHSGRTVEETLVKAASQPAESVARHNPDLHGMLVGYIDTALAWYPADRFQSAGEMLDELFYVKAALDRDRPAPVTPTMLEESSERSDSPPPTAAESGEPSANAGEKWSGAGIMPTNLEFPPAPEELAGEASGPFPTAMIEPPSEAWELEEEQADDDDDLFDPDIFKPSPDFTLSTNAVSAASDPGELSSGSSTERDRAARRDRSRRRHETFKQESDVERAAVIAFDSGAIKSHGDDFDDDLIAFVPEALRPMFQSIERALAGARMYEWEHPDVARRVADALDAILDVLEAYPDHCAFQVRRTEFCVDDETVWRAEEPFDRIPFNLFAAGFRHIQFLPNLTDSDLRAFLQLAMLNPRTDLPIEDDLATAFWDLNLASVKAQMVTSFRVSDDEAEQARFEREVASLEDEANEFFSQEGAEQLKLLIALSELGDGALAQAHYSRPELLLSRRLNRGTFADAYRKQFVDALENDAWLQRSVFVLVAALIDTANEGDTERLSPMLRELVPRFLLDGKPDELLELVDKVALAVPDEHHKDLVFQWVLDRRNVDRFVRYIKNSDEPLSDEARTRAETYLPKGSPEAMEAVLEMFPEFSRHDRELVASYLRSNMDGHQETVAEIALAADRDVALDLVELVSAVIDLATAEALRQILEHAEVDVRRAALEAMAEEYPGEVDDILLDMVKDEDANIRVAALKLATSAGSAAVETYLTERALTADFHELPFTERRLILETLLDIDAGRAQETLIQIVKRKLNLRLDPAAHTTRTVAISLLGEFGTMPEAYEALEDVSKRRIGNPEKVREAARAAMKRWEERR